ncbi:MAG: plasmid stabilization protein [Nitrospinae bacterium CG11_big_fil_rev_8_21_14_0_20_45_15]|nr:MAG: plasmid stabilization protein [Nitrospinae bacterium CG11_big_fil_rev_8_21_14_0_20_45_15]
MSRYELSQKADQDLVNIYSYSLQSFGERQADKYLQDISLCLRDLAKHPLKGREAKDIEDGIYKFNFVSHMIFYVIQPSGIFVARILHKSMDHPHHLEVL